MPVKIEGKSVQAAVPTVEITSLNTFALSRSALTVLISADINRALSNCNISIKPQALVDFRNACGLSYAKAN